MRTSGKRNRRFLLAGMVLLMLMILTVSGHIPVYASGGDILADFSEEILSAEEDIVPEIPKTVMEDADWTIEEEDLPGEGEILSDSEDEMDAGILLVPEEEEGPEAAQSDLPENTLVIEGEADTEESLPESEDLLLQEQDEEFITAGEEQELLKAGSYVTIKAYSYQSYDWDDVIFYTGYQYPIDPGRDVKVTSQPSSGNIGITSIEWLKYNISTGEYEPDTSYGHKFSAGKWKCLLTLNGASSTNINEPSTGVGRIDFAGFPESTVWQGNGNSSGNITYQTVFTVNHPEIISKVTLEGDFENPGFMDEAVIPSFKLDAESRAKGVQLKEIYWIKKDDSSPRWYEQGRFPAGTPMDLGDYYLTVELYCPGLRYVLDEHLSVRYNEYATFSWYDHMDENGHFFGGKPVTIRAAKDGLVYQIDWDYENAMYISDSHASELPADLTIPSKVTFGSKTYNVTGIMGAFVLNEDIETVRIPASVRWLSGAFHECTGLKKVIFGSGSKCATIDFGCFYHCSSIETISLPGSLKELGSEAFNGCSSLREIVCPASVTKIGENVFSSCTSLKKVTFASESKLKSIGDFAFCGCTALESISIPPSAEKITDYAFKECTSLGVVTFQKGSHLKELSQYAFGSDTGKKALKVRYSDTDTAAKAVVEAALKQVQQNGWKYVTPNPYDVSVTKCKYASISDQTYTGDPLKAAPKVTYNGKTLKSGTDYTLSWKNNKKVGTATVTVTGKGDYTGKKERTFKIIPRQTTISSLTAGSKKVTVKWKKKTKQSQGYQIQYSLKSDFSSGNKTKKVKDNTQTSVDIKKLTSKKTYYFRIRTWKEVDGKVYYSGWSGKKSVKVK